MSLLSRIFKKADETPAEKSARLGRQLLNVLNSQRPNSEKAVRLILMGADVNRQRSGGWTPLIIACKKGVLSPVVKTLIEAGANIDHQQGAGFTALIEAAMSDELIKTEMLIEAGANPFIKSTHNRTARAFAEENNSNPAISILREAEKNYPHVHAWETPRELSKRLIMEAEKPVCDVDKCLKLIDAGADIESRNSDNDTPLMMTAKSGNIVLFTLLLKKGAQTAIDKKHPLGRASVFPAIHMAAHHGHADIVKTLLAHGDDANLQDHHGYTPLMYAAIDNRKDVIDVLMTAGADTEIRHHDPDQNRNENVFELCHRLKNIYGQKNDPAEYIQAKIKEIQAVAMLNVDKIAHAGVDHMRESAPLPPIRTRPFPGKGRT